MLYVGWLTFQAVYLFAPLLVAAVGAGVVQHYDVWTALKRPIDGGATLGGRRLFGDNKTWRGVACSVGGSILGVAAQKYLIGDRAAGLAVLDYSHINALMLGTALGLGASAGELPNSFVKRRLGIAPGAQSRSRLGAVFYLWDQVDVLTFTWPILLFWFTPGWSLVLTSFLVAPVLHQGLSILGYAIGARTNPV